MALKGFYYNPFISSAHSNNHLEISISIAPPPGNNLGQLNIFLATPNASWRFLSISLRESFDPPLNKIVHADGFLHYSKYEKYSSPIFLIIKRPHSVPISDSYISSGLFTILAPVTLAILLLSVFLTLLITDIFYYNK